jgi:hypothetical protein
VIVFEHRGIACALPSAQVKQSVAHADGRDFVPLWPGALDGAYTHDRALLIETSEGDVFIECHAARMEEADPASLVEIPPLLASVLDMPHVVGLARGETLLWLVDPARFRRTVQVQGGDS